MRAVPGAISSTADAVSSGAMQGPFALALLVIVVATTAFVVFMERAQRRITVNYAKRQVGRRMYAGQSSHLPFKINMSGVIPPIFASSILLFPATIASFLGTGAKGGVASVMQDVAAALGFGQPLYMVLYGVLIIFFCFFYTALVFNSRETADNLKKSGAFIPGIRPGQQTAEYIDKVLTRLTLWGALYVTAVCLLPVLLQGQQGVSFQFGGTSLLIIVVVVMDFMAQLQAHLMSHHYPGLMKRRTCSA
ncbi:preprotein translocase subunit SecY, partial [mine drainage metagenome]